MKVSLRRVVFHALYKTISDVWVIFWRTLTGLAKGIRSLAVGIANATKRSILYVHEKISQILQFGSEISLFTLLIFLPVLALLDPFGLWDRLSAVVSPFHFLLTKLSAILLLTAFSGLFVRNTFSVLLERLRRGGTEGASGDMVKPSIIASTSAWAIMFVFFGYFFAVRIFAFFQFIFPSSDVAIFLPIANESQSTDSQVPSGTAIDSDADQAAIVAAITDAAKPQKSVELPKPAAHASLIALGNEKPAPDVSVPGLKIHDAGSNSDLKSGNQGIADESTFVDFRGANFGFDLNFEGKGYESIFELGTLFSISIHGCSFVGRVTRVVNRVADAHVISEPGSFCQPPSKVEFSLNGNAMQMLWYSTAGRLSYSEVF